MAQTKRQKVIVTAALNLTAAGGIQNLTIKNLAGLLGVTEPALYRHFAGKQEIVKAMIAGFEDGIRWDAAAHGLHGIEVFAKGRFRQVAANPPLARVMFAEELFMADPECAALLLQLMHRHKDRLRRYFEEAREAGEIRSDLAPDMLFRLVFGPVRLLVKQWGLSGQGFDLIAAGDELWDALSKILK